MGVVELNVALLAVLIGLLVRGRSWTYPQARCYRGSSIYLIWIQAFKSRSSCSIHRLHSVAAVNCGAPRKQGLAIQTEICDPN